jgi:hypothetical protein
VEHRLRVIDNRKLRKVFGPKRDEATGDWRKLIHNEELNDLDSSPTIVRVIKSRRMRWEGHVARMGEGRGMYRILVQKHEGKKLFGRIILRWIFRKWDVGIWTGSSWLRIETGGGHL